MKTVRPGHYQTTVPYGYNANIVIDIVKEKSRLSNNNWRLTVDDSVVSKKHTSSWLTKAEAVEKAHRLVQDGLLEDAIKKPEKAFPEFKNNNTEVSK